MEVYPGKAGSVALRHSVWIEESRHVHGDRSLGMSGHLWTEHGREEQCSLK